MSSILEVKNICKQFGTDGFFLDHLSFSVPYGCIMGLVGENGAGKSTAIGCILNTLFSDSGEILLFGQPIPNKDIREKIGVVYDSDNFPEYLTANRLERILQGIYSHWDSEKYRSFLKMFELKPNQKIGTYSKGMTMKLALAAALSHHAQLLILDEATSGLDPMVRDDFLNLLLDFVQDESCSVLLSSHITGDLEKIADYIAFLHRGRLIFSDSKDNLLYRHGILRCKHTQLEQINPKDILAYQKLDYQTNVLVSDESARNYPEFPFDRTSLDEITLILMKGVLPNERFN